MSVHGNNATAPCPAIAPGSEDISPVEAAVEIGRRGMDPRVLALAPGFDAPFFQAGLAGYSDAAMRLIARRHGCPFCVTEALLDRMLLGGGRGFDKADLDLIRDNIPSGEDDLPLAGQIIGSDPDEMAAAALKVIEQGARPDKHYRHLAYDRTGFPETGTDPRMREWARLRAAGELAPDTAANEEALRERGEPRGEDEEGGGCEADDACGVGEESCSDEIMRQLDGVGGGAEADGAPARRAGREAPESGAAGSARSFTVIDVNLACPVKKIKSKSRGGHWLSEPAGAIELLRAVRDAVPREIPCTVKLRRAFDDTPEQARNFEIIFDAAYEMGYAWSTVHARTVEQKYIGPSRWTFLRDLVRRRPDCVIFGSGDVWEVADIFRMIAYTGVSGVSVARGCIGNPWIFRQARQMMRGEAPAPPTIAEQRAVLLDHFSIAARLNGEKAAGKMMRKFGIRFAAHHAAGEAVRLRMIAVSSTEDWLAVLNEFYGEVGG